MTSQVLVIGEALIDIVETVGGDRELVGGSPANVAIGLARQGHDVTLLTRLGRDDRGARIAAQVEESGAVVADESWSDAATSTARARLRTDGSAEYDFDIDWTIAAPALRDASAVHTGSIALFLEPGGTAVLDALQRAKGRALITLDPNIRPALVGEHREAHARFVAAARTADLVKLSDEDAAWLFPGLLPEQVLAEIAAYGPRIVVITRGGEGALGLGPGGITEVDPYVVDVADTIGAGDAAMASLISSALDDPLRSAPAAGFDRPPRRAGVWAGISVPPRGANPPARAEVDAAL